MTRIKLGLVGIGKIARDQHLPVIALSDEFELVAAASRNARLEDKPTYDSLETMLAAEPSIQAVTLCTPPGPRDRDARAALLRGVDVLLEKPPAATLGAARLLQSAATQAVLCASWHSRHAPAVRYARAWLGARRLLSASVHWKEDIRRWHPGQDWLLDAGGMGVFDPGINALSILTTIVPEPLIVRRAELDVPSNRQAPLGAELAMETRTGAAIAASFDFLWSGAEMWEIRCTTESGELLLADGGARLSIDGAAVGLDDQPHVEYQAVYRAFAACIRARANDCDLRPLELVADAFLIGRRNATPCFDF